MIILATLLLLLPIVLFVYAYFGYPFILRRLGRRLPDPVPSVDPPQWPMVSLTIPAYNEERSIRNTIETLLSLEYPAERRQILIVSDASTDRTDEIVREYRDRGVELLSLPRRSGKSAAENAAVPHLRGEIIVNTDATIRILPESLKALIRVFVDPTIGVASGRDVSVGDLGREGNQAESGYVGYEMQIRELETRLGGIVGASGCFYAIRRTLHDPAFPPALSRDFASAMIAREHGLRAVSVTDAVCLVPRTRSLRAELRRKSRTMARGLETLSFKRHLLDPRRHGMFAFMLLSHKLCRWLVNLTIPLGLFGLTLLWPYSTLARLLLLLSALLGVMGIAGIYWPESGRVPRIFAIPGFIVVSISAGIEAWGKVLIGEQNPIWEPTRRPV
jgi:cellulose synthase/poly-beta-1,6-N-acetylglucosamine synthase-like glycosyltransferase